jgi:hypothetical protein
LAGTYGTNVVPHFRIGYGTLNNEIGALAFFRPWPACRLLHAPWPVGMRTLLLVSGNSARSISRCLRKQCSMNLGALPRADYARVVWLQPGPGHILAPAHLAASSRAINTAGNVALVIGGGK